MASSINYRQLVKDCAAPWKKEIFEELCAYIKIPNKSPSFDTNWEKNGYMDQAMELVAAWCARQAIKGMSMKVHRLPGRTPLLLIDIPGQCDETVVLYGHIDKQPEMRGWDADKGPWLPVLQGDKLYGRGGADDGYAVFAALTAIASLQKNSLPHGHCVVLIEASEESGSHDLPAYLDYLAPQLGQPDLIICLDSGCGNYDTMWSTTSLRGVFTWDMQVKIQKEGIHSGVGSGVVPSWFQVVSELIDRVADREKGEVIIAECKSEIPEKVREQISRTATLLGGDFVGKFPLLPGVCPVANNSTQLMTNQTWISMLSVTGIDGVPAIKDAGNVTLPEVSLKLSVRTPPNCDVDRAAAAFRDTLLANPPHGVQVSLSNLDSGNGWHAPALAEWLEKANDEASQTAFGHPAAYMGEGGSIPFMAMLGRKFPKAQFLITGVLGPQSNAHGPNEFLHLPTAERLTAAVAIVLHKHFLAAR
jgi:acetylornithine deacetylase/succinyl-diaminopimelate desuccinylase-like protein